MRIKSKLKATVMAVAMAAIPLAAQSAGLGRLNVLSGLGQPLRAEIDLVAVQPGEVESLRAALASVEAYREAQIDYPPTALGLRFNLDKRPNGQYFIAVNSAQSLNEPFLDFLVELKWDGGRVLREYTALLDPVGYNPNGVTAAPVAGRPAAAPARPQPTLAPQPAKPMVAAKPEPVAKPAQEAAPAPSGQTHTVQQGETLAGIARQNQVDGVSLEQMLVGLYRANQGAFDGNNMNRLKKGRILTVPSRETLTEVDRQAAIREVKVQADDWRSYRAKLAGSAGASQADQAPGSGKITAKVEDKAASQLPAAKDTLKLSKGDEGKLRERMQSLEEEASARQKALAEANQRVSELEKTNKKLEELLALKNKQGAELQKQAEAAKAAAAKPVEKAAEVKPTPTPAPTPAPTPVPVEPPKVEAKPAEPAAAEPAAEAKPVEAPTPVLAPPPAETPKPKKKPVFVPEPEPEPSLLENPLVLGGGALAVLAAIGGAVFAMRRRKRGNFEDSVITGSDLKSNTMVGNTGGAVISTGVTENSFLTDFSRAGLGTIDTDEVDPIAEAEVYMAYGRDAQAEEILKDALTRDGSRQEVRLKLLEIYSGRKNVAAFEQLAQELYAGTQGQGPLWAQAAEMGRGLDPHNSLYQHQAPVDTNDLDKTMVLSAGTLSALAEGKAENLLDTAQPVVDVAGDLDFQLGDIEEPAAPAAEADTLDFDLGFNAAAPAPAPVPQAAAPQPEPVEATMVDVAPAEDASLDFNLGDFNLDLPAAAAEPAPAPVARPDINDGILSLDIPLELGGDAKQPAMPSFDLAEPVLAPAELESPDLASDLDFNFDLGEPAAAGGDASIDAAALDLGDMNIDLDVAPEPANGSDIIDFGAELDDPVTTKIDLARAYIDMGDKEGAREILQEALHEGNSEQKSTAESLLAQL